MMGPLRPDDPPMDEPHDHPSPDSLDDAALARLADGSLPEPEREALRARVQASPALRARLAEQEHAVALLRATDELAAPASLHAAVRGLTARESAGRERERERVGDRRARRGRWAALAIPASTVAIAVAVVVIVLLGHGTGAPTVRGAARLALASSTAPAPVTDPRDRDLLALRAAGIPFPSYLRGARWRASGARHDSLAGRRVTTVFYRWNDSRVGYAIVSGRALALPRGTARRVDGVRYVLAAARGGRLITWRRDGHTCVIAGRAVSDRALLELATADEAAAA